MTRSLSEQVASLERLAERARCIEAGEHTVVDVADIVGDVIDHVRALSKDSHPPLPVDVVPYAHHQAIMREVEKRCNGWKERAKQLERELAALREQHAKTEAHYDEQMAMRRRADEFLDAMSWENTDHAAERVMNELARVTDERNALRASPSPSAGAVPEVRVERDADEDDDWIVVLGTEFPCVAWSSTRTEADQMARNLRIRLADVWPDALPHADAGGEDDDGKTCMVRGCTNEGEFGGFCSKHDDDAYEAATKGATAAAAEAARRDEREAILTIVRQLPFNDRAAMTWGDIVRRIEKRVDARAAEREKTETSEAEQQEEAPSDAEATSPDDRRVPAGSRSAEPGSAPQEPGATPAPCPRCGGTGLVNRWFGSRIVGSAPCPECCPVCLGVGGSIAVGGRAWNDCTACSGTGRAPASSPVPAGPALQRCAGAWIGARGVRGDRAGASARARHRGDQEHPLPAREGLERGGREEMKNQYEEVHRTGVRCAREKDHDGPHRPAHQGHVCHAIGCNVSVPPKMLMCLRHWRMVPRDLQRRIWATYVPGQERRKDPTGEYLVAMRDAVSAVAEREGRAAITATDESGEGGRSVNKHERASRTTPRAIMAAVHAIAVFSRDAWVNIDIEEHRAARIHGTTLRHAVDRGLLECNRLEHNLDRMVRLTDAGRAAITPADDGGDEKR